MTAVEQNLIATTLSKADFNRWSSFISRNGGGFFQSPAYFTLCQRLPGMLPYVITVEKNGELLGSILVVIQSNGKTLKKYFTRRSIIIGGPVLKSDDWNETVITKLLCELNRQVRNRAIYTEFRNLFDLSQLKKAFSSQGFNYEDHLNIQIQLTDEYSVKKRFSSSKIRQIKKSTKNGVEIAEAQSIREVKRFYIILADLYASKIRKPLPPWEFFRTLYESSIEEGSVKFLLVKAHEEILGGIIAPVYNRVIYEWYIANKDIDGNKIFPGVMATWAAIDYGLKNNLNSFDFLGAGSPSEEYGVREFKSKFGGELVQHGRFIRINNKVLYGLGKTIINLKRKH